MTDRALQETHMRLPLTQNFRTRSLLASRREIYTSTSTPRRIRAKYADN
jgi:hypothetical protein